MCRNDGQSSYSQLPCSINAYGVPGAQIQDWIKCCRLRLSMKVNILHWNSHPTHEYPIHVKFHWDLIGGFSGKVKTNFVERWPGEKEERLLSLLGCIMYSCGQIWFYYDYKLDVQAVLKVTLWLHGDQESGKVCGTRAVMGEWAINRWCVTFNSVRGNCEREVWIFIIILRNTFKRGTDQKKREHSSSVLFLRSYFCE